VRTLTESHGGSRIGTKAPPRLRDWRRLDRADHRHRHSLRWERQADYGGRLCFPDVQLTDHRKGYEIGPGDYIAFEPEEIAKAVPEADKTLDVEAFVAVRARGRRIFRPPASHGVSPGRR
jgi:hypothetical protein